MANIWWEWDGPRGREPRFHELAVDIKIHNDIGNFSERNGMYLMVAQGDISGVGFYFGLQTDIQDPITGRGRGKGLIFSRWLTRDLADTRTAPGGFAQSSGHEGDFVGVRFLYEWTQGEYLLRLAHEEADEEGQWFGLWITDLTTGTEAWAGSMRFPFRNGKALIHGITYTTSEIYGRPIRPIDIPELHVSVSMPRGDGEPADWGTTDYAPFTNSFKNAEIHYDRRNDVVNVTTGGTTERKTQPRSLAVPTSWPKRWLRSGLGVPLSNRMRMGDRGPEVLCHVRQYRPHLLFVRSVEPFNAFVDCRALCKVFEQHIHRQTSAREDPVATDLAGYALHLWTRAPVCHFVTSRSADQ